MKAILRVVMAVGLWALGQQAIAAAGSIWIGGPGPLEPQQQLRLRVTNFQADVAYKVICLLKNNNLANPDLLLITSETPAHHAPRVILSGVDYGPVALHPQVVLSHVNNFLEITPYYKKYGDVYLTSMETVDSVEVAECRAVLLDSHG
ncbi:MAG: hypothetical protein HY939_06945 [Gammaproteobacteria bacterium]|nr:hypothetical protein [Gammaproteobacteria bacterium]